jgi:hypothetical protein
LFIVIIFEIYILISLRRGTDVDKEAVGESARLPETVERSRGIESRKERDVKIYYCKSDP